MCTPSTLGSIAQETLDKQRIALQERFLNPLELLTRFANFHLNAEAICQPTKNICELNKIIHDLHSERAREFKEALIKQNIAFDFDSENRDLFINWGEIAHTEDHGAFLLDIGSDGKIVGIEIFNLVGKI